MLIFIISSKTKQKFRHLSLTTFVLCPFYFDDFFTPWFLPPLQVEFLAYRTLLFEISSKKNHYQYFWQLKTHFFLKLFRPKKNHYQYFWQLYKTHFFLKWFFSSWILQLFEKGGENIFQNIFLALILLSYPQQRLFRKNQETSCGVTLKIFWEKP